MALVRRCGKCVASKDYYRTRQPNDSVDGWACPASRPWHLRFPHCWLDGRAKSERLLLATGHLIRRQHVSNFLSSSTQAKVWTFVERWHSFLKINQSRRILYAVLLSFLWFFDPDEIDAFLVSFVVNVFQFGQNSAALLLFLIVCTKFRDSYGIYHQINSIYRKGQPSVASCGWACRASRRWHLRSPRYWLDGRAIPELCPRPINCLQSFETDEFFWKLNSTDYLPS